MRRVACFLLGLMTLLLGDFATEADAQEQRKVIVCSTTQVADFARQVVGDRWEVQCILAPGTDPHLYQITSRDALAVAKADLCLENGWHLEGNEWMKTLARDAGKPLVSCVTGIKPIELEDKGQKFPDPHTWFSPKNAAIYVRNIRDAVTQLDPAHAEQYAARTDLYLEQLRTLHNWIVEKCNALPANRRVLVTSHDAFNYFCRDFGFKSAAPAGWSTGQEIGGGVTTERRKETVDSIKSFGVKAIFVETTVNPTLVEEIAREAGVKIGGQLYSDSMGKAGTAGESYIGMMRENVLLIVHALK